MTAPAHPDHALSEALPTLPSTAQRSIEAIRADLAAINAVNTQHGNGTSLSDLLYAFVQQIAEDAADLFGDLHALPMALPLVRPGVPEATRIERLVNTLRRRPTPPARPTSTIAHRRLGAQLQVKVKPVITPLIGERYVPLDITARAICLGEDGRLRASDWTSRCLTMPMRRPDGTPQDLEQPIPPFVDATSVYWQLLDLDKRRPQVLCSSTSGIPGLQLLGWLQPAIQAARSQTEEIASLLAASMADSDVRPVPRPHGGREAAA